MNLNNQFSKDEILWFKNNYCLKKRFSYDPIILAPNNKFKQLILKLGSHVDYYLFVKINKENLCLTSFNSD